MNKITLITGGQGTGKTNLLNKMILNKILPENVFKANNQRQFYDLKPHHLLVAFDEFLETDLFWILNKNVFGFKVIYSVNKVLCEDTIFPEIIIVAQTIVYDKIIKLKLDHFFNVIDLDKNNQTYETYI